MLKKYPIVGACGLNCSLCLRYHTEGTSTCPGCCGPDFWQKHPRCSFITCCVEWKGLETCAQCNEWTDCDKVTKVLDSAKYHDSFISYRPLVANFTFIQKNGIVEFVRLEMEKQRFLRHLIDKYDEGRSKGFYCASCQLVPLARLKEALADAETKITKDTDTKGKAKIVRQVINNLTDSLQIDLKLRK